MAERLSGSTRASGRAVLATGATSLLAIAAVAGLYRLTRPKRGGPEGSSGAAQASGTALLEGRDYRVLVAVARVRPERPGGGKWDAGSVESAAPDPYYEVWWRETLVFKSQEVENALVASWSSVALPDLFDLVAGERVSPESIKEGALIQARAADAIRIRIWDDDPVENDLIEEFTVSIAELRVGDQVREGRSGLESVTLRVLPRDAQHLAPLVR